MLNREPFFGRQSAPPAPSPAPKQATASAPQSSANAQPAPAPTASSLSDSAKKGTDTPVGSQLIVGPNIKLKGVEITDCDTLVVEGHVEATMDSRAIRISEHGTFSGTAGIDVAEIHGGFSGELTVRTCLTIHAGGKVSGKIRYGRVVIEEGGEISGDVKKLSDDEKNSRSSITTSSAKSSVATAA